MSTRKVFIAFVTVLVLAVVLAGVDTWKTYAQGSDGDCGQRQSGHGSGMMMGSSSMPCREDMQNGHSMMGQQGMMGGMGSQGMMGGMINGQNMMNDQGMMAQNMVGVWTPPAELAPAGDTLTADEAATIAEAYIATYNDNSLTVGEVIPFSTYFYAQAVEVEGGRAAFEFQIDAESGTVYLQHGPIMMWNLRYGMHANAGMGMMSMSDIPADADGVEMTVSLEQAQVAAQLAVDGWQSGLTVASEAATFYGYYTFKVLDGETVAGLVSVNGYTGQVWSQQWHNAYMAANLPQ